MDEKALQAYRDKKLADFVRSVCIPNETDTMKAAGRYWRICGRINYEIEHANKTRK